MSKSLVCDNCGEELTQGKQYYALHETCTAYCSVDCLLAREGEQGIVDEGTIETFGEDEENDD